MTTPELHNVYKAVNRPLTILGAERKLFFVALTMGAAGFNLFNSLVTGILLFAGLYLLALWASRTDDQILRILVNAKKFKTRYDPQKLKLFPVDWRIRQ
jgi:type IV secretory pathway TrbD component